MMARGSSWSLAVPFWVDSRRCPFDRKSLVHQTPLRWVALGANRSATGAECRAHSSNSRDLGLQRREPPARCQWYGTSLSNTHCFHSEMSSRASRAIHGWRARGLFCPPGNPSPWLVYISWPSSVCRQRFFFGHPQTHSFTYLSQDLGRQLHHDLGLFCHLQACSRPWHCTRFLQSGQWTNHHPGCHYSGRYHYIDCDQPQPSEQLCVD